MAKRDTTNATLAGGCFWCLEAVFDLVPGVTNVVSGYCGGHVPTPSYENVCTGNTGHAEAVQLTFDPTQISYRDLLKLFFAVHDPTTLDRQGPDVGSQYRSVIFYHDHHQKTIANEVIEELQNAGIWMQSIVTEVVALTEFYKAEDYHQEYYKNNTDQPYCQVVITPKLAKLPFFTRGNRWT